MKIVLWLLVLFSCPSLFAETLSLKGAVSFALENSPLIKESSERVNEIRTEVPLAKSALYPNLNAVVTGAELKDAPNSGSATKTSFSPYSQYTAAIKLNQPLFKYGIRNSIDAAEQDLHISNLDNQINRRNLIASVIQAYYQIVLYQRNVETLHAQQKIANETVEFTNKRVRTGRSESLDLLQAKTQVELLHGQVSTAENNLQIALANFANLLGKKNSEGLSVISKIDLSKASMPEQKANSRVKVFEIEQSELAIKKVEDEKEVLKGEIFPTLDLVGSYNFLSTNFPTLLSEQANSWTVGLQLTIPLFSGFSTVEKRRALVSQELQLKFHKAGVENHFSYLEDTNRRKLEIARDAIQTGIEGLKLATASSNEARRKNRFSTIDFLQYLNIQQAQSQAEQALNSAQYNYISALTDYFSATGKDLNDLVETLSQN